MGDLPPGTERYQRARSWVDCVSSVELLSGMLALMEEGLSHEGGKGRQCFGER